MQALDHSQIEYFKTEHAFARYMNPHLAKLLEQMALDKEFMQAEGCHLYDRSGHRYLDFLAQYGALPFGHNPPHIWQAIRRLEQDQVPNFSQPSYPMMASELARKLVEITPAGLEKVTFSNSGAEAVEAAIKLARATTGKQAILSARNAFHGKTMGALSATPKPKYQDGFFLPVSGFDYVQYDDLEALSRKLSSGIFAAFLVEPIQGEGGIVVPADGYLKGAQELCKKHKTLFIVDEIQTGLGRTGAMFVSEAQGLNPDILLTAKALSGGLVPIGACICTDEVYNQDFALKHTSTYSGNAMACAAGLATIELLQENNSELLQRVSRNGHYLVTQMQALKQRFPQLISEVRGRGFMLGIKFKADYSNGQSDLILRTSETDILAALVMSHLLNRYHIRIGYTLNDGGVLRIQPPLVANQQDCQYFIRCLHDSIEELLQGNTARYTAHLAKADHISITPNLQRKQYIKACKQKDDFHFAFLIHPLNEASYTNMDETFSAFSDTAMKNIVSCIADNFCPFVAGDVRIAAGDGTAGAFGEFILIPHTAEQLSQMPFTESNEIIREAVELAHERGAKLVGLGAFTSVVTGGGLSIADKCATALTTGNLFTVSTTFDGIQQVLQQQAKSLRNTRVAVIGANGSIGRAMSMLLAKQARQLILIGNASRPRQSQIKLQRLCKDIIVWLLAQSQRQLVSNPNLGAVFEQVLRRVKQHSNSSTISNETLETVTQLLLKEKVIVLGTEVDKNIQQADVVVLATSATQQLINAGKVKRGAVICDVSRPMNIDFDDFAERPDVTLLEGGIVAMPGDSLLGFNAGLDDNLAYACMAETMLLALEQHTSHMGLGSTLDLDQVEQVRQYGIKHGFQIIT